jgi:ABC-type transport system substrate-binding protein
LGCGQTPILNKKIAENPDFGTVAGGLDAGSGPLMVKEFESGVKYLLVDNPNYWGKRYNISAMDVRAVKDSATRSAALQSGEVGLINSPPPPELPSLEQKGMVYKLHEQKLPFDDYRVRKAANLAIDRESIVKEMTYSIGKVPDSVSPRGYVDHDPIVGPDQPMFPYDVEGAKALLAEAGYPNGPPQTIVMSTTQGQYLADREIAVATAGYLENVGFKMKVDIQDRPTWFARGRSQRQAYSEEKLKPEDVDYNMMEWLYGGGTAAMDTVSTGNFLGAQTHNYGYWKVPEAYAKENDLAAQATNPDEWVSHLKAMNKIHFEELPDLFICHLPITTAMYNPTRVGGLVSYDINGNYNMTEASTWRE